MNFSVDGTAPSSGSNILGVIPNLNPNKHLAKVKPGSVWTNNLPIGNKQVYYKDFNNDGYITNDEIYKIDTLTQNDDRTIQVNRMIDNDGDGYADQRITSIYDEDGNLLEEVSESIDIGDAQSSGQPTHCAEDVKMSNILFGWLEQLQLGAQSHTKTTQED